MGPHVDSIIMGNTPTVRDFHYLKEYFSFLFTPRRKLIDAKMALLRFLFDFQGQISLAGKFLHSLTIL